MHRLHTRDNVGESGNLLISLTATKVLDGNRILTPFNTSLIPVMSNDRNRYLGRDFPLPRISPFFLISSYYA